VKPTAGSSSSLWAAERLHPQFRDQNRRGIGRSQSIWTDSKMETAGSRVGRPRAEAAARATAGRADGAVPVRARAQSPSDALLHGEMWRWAARGRASGGCCHHTPAERPEGGGGGGVGDVAAAESEQALARVGDAAAVARELEARARPRLPQSTRLLIESRWVSKPLAPAGKLRPRRLNNWPFQTHRRRGRRGARGGWRAGRARRARWAGRRGWRGWRRGRGRWDRRGGVDVDLVVARDLQQPQHVQHAVVVAIFACHTAYTPRLVIIRSD
jgi:hypothetical protein